MAIRCLIVDDNEQFLRTARSLLERDGITVVAVASTGADAVAQAGRIQPDLVLVDVMLGAENGFDIARRLTAETVHRMDVIMISSYGLSDIGVLINSRVTCGFLSKAELSGAAIRRLVETER